MYAGVYCLRDKSNGKRYVGSSKHVQERLLEHLSQLETHTHSNEGLQEAFDRGDLEFRILEKWNDPKDKHGLLACEQKWIDHYDSTNPELGYNKINSQSYVFEKNQLDYLTSKSIWYIIMDEMSKHHKYIRTAWNIYKRLTR